ncbi:MAG TPA: YqaJ viral recombinase family protein [Nitrososphaeraceae archaeon]
MTVQLTQRTEEWLNFRKSGIGASDAPVIMKVSPWKTPYELWQEKLNLRAPPIVNFIDKEEEARKCFEYKMGIEAPPEVLIHSELQWMFASLDGFNKSKNVLLEIKCPGQHDHNFVKNNKIVPEKYYPQLQHQMEVAGVDKCYYFSYVSHEDNVTLEINRDEKYINNLIKKEEDFFSCMKNFISPELTNKDYEFIDNNMWNNTVKEWLEVDSYLNDEKFIEYSKREKELRATLIALSGGNSCRGAGIKVRKAVRKGNIDYSKIEVLKGVDLDKYRKDPTEYFQIIKE